MPIHKLTAEFVINTPLFMSGADQEQAELRVSSIKGAIRFWWRALNYSKYEGSAAEKIAAMKIDEDKLFGSTTGQSQVLFSINDQTSSPTKDLPETKNKTPEGLGLRYLGYGVMKSNGSLERPCIPNGKFTLSLLSKTPIGNCISDAIKLFGLVGGLGSRSRKGYGSVTLQSLNKEGVETWLAPTDYKNYVEKITPLLGESYICKTQPQITAFYKGTEIYYLGEKDIATDMLGHYGLTMMRYRSYGSKRKIRDYTVWDKEKKNHKKLFDSEIRFKDDHDWAKGHRSNKNIDDFNTYHPERIIFGLPHNYDQQTRSEVKPKEHERRASPLFFHIHKMGNSYAGIALIMKSDFLPDGEKISANNKPVEQKADYSLLTQFITGTKQTEPDKEKAYFPDQHRILPQTKEDKT